MKLTSKAQAAYELIRASGETEISYHGAGGAILKDGTKIHSHTIKSLRRAGLVKHGNWFGSGKPWTWAVVTDCDDKYCEVHNRT
jgi:hypothetical protein